jgi:hypothetical protein
MEKFFLRILVVFYDDDDDGGGGGKWMNCNIVL